MEGRTVFVCIDNGIERREEERKRGREEEI
jgi:hypothetical protein